VSARHVTSADGTRIGYRTSGDGPPVVLVHGALADHTTMARVVPLLAPHVTVHAVDRRGRGASGDGAEYSIEHEYSDVAAVVDAVAAEAGAPVTLYGHSYGARLALGAALRTSAVARLCLYEPAFRGAVGYGADVLERLDALVSAGRAEQAVECAFTEVVGVSEADLAGLRALPSWPGRVAAAATIPRELRIGAVVPFDPQQYRDLAVPTLVLVGELSNAGQRGVCAAVVAALRDARSATLPGQEHMAQMTAPELVARELLAWAVPGGRPGRWQAAG
jgi:pimeloyl-ACP methyl ester carboxylesterase